MFDRMRQDKGKALADWPAWCYLPMAAAYAAVSGGRVAAIEAMRDVAALSAMAAWRLTKGVYRYDPEVYAALVATPMDPTKPIPAEVLYRLPEWGMYLETPGLAWTSTILRGCWIHLEYDANNGRHELRLLLDCIDDRLVQVPIHLGSGSVLEAIDRMTQEAQRIAAGLGVVADCSPQTNSAMAQSAAPLLSLILYLCSSEPEIEDRLHPGSRPGRPAPKRTRQGYRLFEADKIRVWDVGLQTGRLIREAKAVTQSHDDTARASPRPHMRVAHWHGVWSGPMSGPRKFAYRWYPPIIVGV
ncbi:MAG: hypothetical protein HQL56_18445 [Magnetococcales bacterium]|nr:hypothetical protein [Magnetococcales bacterium]